MSIFVLKIIAMISMVIDHSRYLHPILDNDITKVIGRFSFILFAFILTEGIWHTKDRTKYLKRIVLFAVVSQIPFMIFRSIVGRYIILNILFTFAIGMILIILIDKQKNEYIKLLIAIVGIVFSILVPIDYGVYGIVLIIIMYYTRKTRLFDLGFFIINMIYYGNKAVETNYDYKQLVPYMIGTYLTYIFLKLYNGKLGKKVKFLYLFYPIHLVILFLIYCIWNNINLITLG